MTVRIWKNWLLNPCWPPYTKKKYLPLCFVSASMPGQTEKWNMEQRVLWIIREEVPRLKITVILFLLNCYPSSGQNIMYFNLRKRLLRAFPWGDSVHWILYGTIPRNLAGWAFFQVPSGGEARISMTCPTMTKLTGSCKGRSGKAISNPG